VIPKQDRQGVRQAKEIEQKYDLNQDFSAIEKMASNAQRSAEYANIKAQDATASVEAMSGQLVSLDGRVSTLESGTYSRKNLLHNWFFGCVVNQRGKTEYTENGAFTIDRWKSFFCNVIVNDGYITLSKQVEDYSGAVVQPFENLAYLANKTVTFSIMDNHNNVFSATMTVNSEGETVCLFDKYMCAVNLATNSISVGLGFGDGANSADIFAAKLEIGIGQTLAHLDNGVWVLNEIPDFAEQLAICQRYYFKGAARYAFAGAADGGFYYVPMFNFPVTMRTAPACAWYSLANTGGTLSQFDGTDAVIIYQPYESNANSPGVLRLSGNGQQVYYCTVIADAELK